jgi:hypothetical protein
MLTPIEQAIKLLKHLERQALLIPPIGWKRSPRLMLGRAREYLAQQVRPPFPARLTPSTPRSRCKPAFRGGEHNLVLRTSSIWTSNHLVRPMNMWRNR